MDTAQPLPLQFISSLYQTSVREFTFAGTGMEKIADLNARRWFIQFHLCQFAGAQYVLPGPTLATTITPLDTNLPLEYKFKDCPSIAQGEFYGQGMLGSSIIIVECEYTR